MKHIDWNEIWEFIVKNAALFIGISLSMSAKIAIDSRSRKLTKKEIWAKIFIGFFCGFVTVRYCIAHGMEGTASWAAPLATMGWEGVLLWLTANANRLYKVMAKRWFGLKDEDLKDN